jgi:hypothetical protein
MPTVDLPTSAAGKCACRPRRAEFRGATTEPKAQQAEYRSGRYSEGGLTQALLGLSGDSLNKIPAIEMRDKTMKTPGFTADSALYMKRRSYLAASAWSVTDAATNILPQLNECQLQCQGDAQEIYEDCLTECKGEFCTEICEDRRASYIATCEAACGTTSTCTPCTAGSCNAPPNCGRVPNSGTQTCTDSNGHQSTRPC